MQDVNDSTNTQGASHDQEDDTSLLKSIFKKQKMDKEDLNSKCLRIPGDKDSNVYNMCHPKRGVAYIFNHKTFKSEDISQRDGTDKDRDDLKKTLEDLDFEVQVHNDFCAKEIKKCLKEAAEKNHDDEDCILVVVLTHGGLNRLEAFDVSYDQEEIWLPFTPENCPSLAEKPKLFVFQACQGDKKDSGFKARGAAPSKAGSTSNSFTLPTHIDFLLAYSTVPGFQSWRNAGNGSWFIQALCGVLRQEGSTRDLLSMLTKVTRKVAYDFQSQTDDEETNKKKQTPSFTSRLTKDVYFTKKALKDGHNLIHKKGTLSQCMGHIL